jgi:hypothetical protein
MPDNGGMDSTTRRRNRYDHRLCDLVRATGNIVHATRRGIPRSTARGWLSSRHSRLVTLDVVDQDRQRLQQEVLALRRRAARLLALLRVMVILWKMSGCSLNTSRISGSCRLRLVAAIGQSRSVLPLRLVLRIIGLSPSSYHAWRRDRPCAREEVSACPRFLAGPS